MKVCYPSWRYHATEPARIVQTQAESEALGPGWSDSAAPVVASPPVPRPDAPAPVGVEVKMPESKKPVGRRPVK
ncbi:MAG: hypothetical protein NTY02_05035 [Acidobacteria bacterium]|nr:hypothetical protein [Acidobacteriota bacterium]